MNKEELHARLNQLSPQIEPIQGWLHPNAGAVMYQFAMHAAPTIVELGSWKGRSTAWFGSAIKDRGQGRVYAVDTWVDNRTEQTYTDLLKGYGPNQLYDEFVGNMRRLGLEGVVEPWRMTTIEAARKWSLGSTIGVLYIDAGHEYHEVRADFEHWAPFVAPGGYIVFDDVPGYMGPTRLITELPNGFTFMAAPPNQWWVRKNPP